MAVVSGNLTTTYDLSLADPNLTVGLNASIKTSGTNAIEGFSGAAWNVINYGTVSSTNGLPGTYGVYLTGLSTEAITNNGEISGAGGVNLTSGGTVTNAAGAIIQGTGPTTSGISVVSGVHFSSGTGTVYNSGTITALGYGVSLDDGGSVTNYSTGSITGGKDAIFFYGASGYVDNFGQITATVGDGVGFFAGGTLINEATGKINAQSTGGAVYFGNIGGTLINYGSMTGTNYGAFFDSSETGCVVTNYAGALLQGGLDGVYIGIGTVTNAGTIAGFNSVYFATASASNLLIVDPGAVFNGAAYGNGGTLELAAGAGAGEISKIGSSGNFQAFSTLKIDSGATWTLGGSGNTIANLNDGGTLTLAGSLTVTAAASLTNATINLNGVSFTDANGLTLGAGGALSGHGVVATGTTTATELQGGGAVTASGGVLEFSNAVDQTGTATSFFIADGATLQFDDTIGTAAITPNVTFQGVSGALVASAAAAGSVHLGTIAGFSGSDTIQLKAFGASDAYSVNGYTLTISNGTNSESLTFAAGTAMGQIVVIDNVGVDTIAFTPIVSGNLTTTYDLSVADPNLTVGLNASIKTSGTNAIEGFGAPSAALTFAAGAAPTVKLDDTGEFRGTIAGFSGHDQIDLADIGFDRHTTLAYRANPNGGGTSYVHNGWHSADIALLEQYSAASFAASSNGHGGTLITEPPPFLVQNHLAQTHVG
jgi:hypothetical protein